jgi:hypothetical protein
MIIKASEPSKVTLKKIFYAYLKTRPLEQLEAVDFNKN